MDPALPPKNRRSGLSLWMLLAGLILLAGGVYLLQHNQQLRIKQAQLAREAKFAAEVAPPPPPTFFETVDFAGGTKLSFDNAPERAGANALELASGAAQGAQEHFKEVASRANYPHLLIPVSLQGPRSRDRVNEYYAFRHREVDAYQRLTQDTGAARDAGLAFLETYIKHVSAIPEAPTSDEVRALGNAALAAGSRDPLVRTYAAFFERQETGNVSPFEDVLKETIPELSTRKYPAIVQMFARMWAFSEMKLNGFSLERRWQPALVAIIRWLEEDARGPSLRTCVYWRLSRIWNTLYPEKRGQLVTAMLELGPGRIDPWLTHTFLGRYYRDIAWDKRGDGLADTVTDEGWEGFRRNLVLAATHLKYAWHLAPDMPQPAEQMIGVAMADDDVESRPYDWFLRAVEAEFDFTEAYWSLHNSLRLRWGGSQEEIFTFCRRCIETGQFETQIPYLAINFLHDFEKAELSYLGLASQKLEDVPAKPIVEQFAAAVTEYRKHHPDAVLWGDSPRDRTNVAVFYERFGMYDTVLAEARALGDRFDTGELHTNGRLGHYRWMRLVAAEKDDIRQRVFDFDKELRTPWAVDTPATVIEELQTEYQALKDLVRPEELLSTLYFEHADKIISQLRTFHETGEVTLDFDEHCRGWDVCAGRSERDAVTGSLSLFRREGQPIELRVRPLAQFAPPILVQAELTMLDPPPYPAATGLEWYREDLVRGPQHVESLPYWTFAAGIREETKQPMLTAYYLGPPNQWNAERLISSSLTQRMELRLWSHGYEGRIGPFTQLVRPRDPTDPEGYLTIGEAYAYPQTKSFTGRYTGRGALRVANVRIQRLRSGPPPEPDASCDERVRYWEARVTDDGPESRAALELARVQLEQQRTADAEQTITRLEQAPDPILGINTLRTRLLIQQGHYQESVAVLRRALDEPGDDLLAVATSGELFAAAPDSSNLRHSERAKADAEFAVRYSHEKEPFALAALAAALANQGAFPKAAETNRKALELANDALKPLLEQRQLLYEANQPFRYPERSP